MKAMKKTITTLLMCATFCLVNVKAQTYFGPDVTINNVPGYKQSQVKLTSAFNGWLFSAAIYTSATDNYYEVRKSVDKGFTWTYLYGSSAFSTTSSIFDDIEIEAAGTDTNNLVVSFARVRHDVSPINYTIIIFNIDAQNGSGSTSTTITEGAKPINDIDLATDYLSPSFVSAPYSVGLVYSVTGSSKDSIVYLGSTDGGATYPYRKNIMTTSSYSRKVAISYGKSLSASNGRYFATWETTSFGARTGHVYASRSTASPSTGWEIPKNLDSIGNSTNRINRLRNPKITTLNNSSIDSDSGGVGALIVFERDYDGTGTDNDILGYVNLDASNINNKSNWILTFIANASTNHTQPDLVYHDSANAFLLTYYDSAASILNYESHSFNYFNPSASWTTIKPQYNDGAAGPNPYPRLAYNPQEKKVAAVWASESGGANPKALFDSDYSLLVSSLATEKPKTFEINVFPNPAKDFINVKLDLKQASQVCMELIDMTGKSILKNNYGNISGEQNFRYDFSDLKTGLYIMQLKTDKETVGYKISVEK
jgi:hypothetical protein